MVAWHAALRFDHPAIATINARRRRLFRRPEKLIGNKPQPPAFTCAEAPQITPATSIIAEIEAAIPALRRYAWALLRNGDEADELVQECLVRALGRLPSPSTDLRVRPWLFTILHNLSVSRWRALRRRGQPVDAAEAELAVPASQEWSLSVRDLMRGLALLPLEQRQVLLLVGVEGLEYREAAAVLGLPVGTVMSRLSRGRDGLRAQMEGRERPALRRVK